MKTPYQIVIDYMNGSSDVHSFKTYSDAEAFWRDGISYSGGRVKRVTLECGKSRCAVWDASWDDYSKHVGIWGLRA